MTQEELNYIKDSFSQILDDIGGNPDWYEAAKAVASDLGTMEKQLEERVTKLPSNMDEAAIDFADNARKQLYSKDYAIASIADYDHGCIDGFKAGAEWIAEQGAIKCYVAKDKDDSLLISNFKPYRRHNGYLDTDSFKWINISPILSRELFPDTKLEDDPIEVIVQIRKK